MAATKAAIVWDTALKAYRVNVPYNAQILTIFKLIPPTERSFDPLTKMWFFQEKHLDAIEAVVKKFFTVNVMTRQTVESFGQGTSNSSSNSSNSANAPQQQRGMSVDEAILTLMKESPSQTVKKFYRELCIELHPDKEGGDAEKMARINSLWTIAKTHWKL